MNEDNITFMEEMLLELKSHVEEVEQYANDYNDAKEVAENSIQDFNSLSEDYQPEVEQICDKANSSMTELAEYIQQQFGSSESDPESLPWQLYKNIKTNGIFSQEHEPQEIETYDIPSDLDATDNACIDTIIEQMEQLIEKGSTPELSLESLQEEFHNYKIKTQLRLDTQASLIETIEDRINNQDGRITQAQSDLNTINNRQKQLTERLDDQDETISKTQTDAYQSRLQINDLKDKYTKLYDLFHTLQVSTSQELTEQTDNVQILNANMSVNKIQIERNVAAINRLEEGKTE